MARKRSMALANLVIWNYTEAFCGCLVALVLPLQAAELTLPETFAGHWETIGRGSPQVSAYSVTLQDGFIMTKESWGDCEFAFSARAPQNASQVQIWAGIHVRDRDSRYVFGLRGGDDNDVYLARYGPDGEGEFLGVAPLDFRPQPGTWYDLRAVARGNRFQIYVNNESLPRINVIDDVPPWSQGGVSLGGGWLAAEFRRVKVSQPSGPVETRVWRQPAIDREMVRERQRAAYQPLRVDRIEPNRTEVSLDGKWLFLPDQELSTGIQPEQPACDDGKWHVMDVPAFWTPCGSWLYGETGFPLADGISSSKGISDNFYEEERKRLDQYTFDWEKTKSAWYREEVDLPETVAGRHSELDFDAIAKIAQVWVNGKPAGSHTGMFGDLKCDISQLIRPGKNIIAVHVIGQPEKKQDNKILGTAVTVDVTSAMLNSLPHGMFREDISGIWQPVKLVITNPVAISDVFIRPRLDGASFDVELRDDDPQAARVEIGYVIRSAKDGSVLNASINNTSVLLPPGKRQTIELSTPVLAPKPWSPDNPNLYRLELQVRSDTEILDRTSVTFGFRTFGVEKGRLVLNGKPYWLRGADHFPNGLRPNDSELARRFIQVARDGNVRVTRSHAVPFTEAWLNASDEIGMGVSYEGTWPWLMLQGEPPDPQLLRVWKDEFASLIQKYRNHPSILLWTVNNEMKFPSFDKDKPDLLAKKWSIVDDMIRTMRSIDPTRPIVADSSYFRKGVGAEYDDFIRPHGFDDGDIDDVHAYYGWYDPSFFHFFKGEFGSHAWPGRPLISQEMSTGYPQNDDGHPTRFYLFKHQTPQSLVGDQAYEDRDPAFFLVRQAFMTKELAETLRRTGRGDCDGIFHFAYLSWFKDVWDVEAIQPFPTYFALQTALQPVLVSAELRGRHFYAGATVRRRVCVVNDADDGGNLPPTTLIWKIVCEGQTLSQGSVPVSPLQYYSNEWIDVDFKMPDMLPSPRIDGQLLLSLEREGKSISENIYDVTLTTTAWATEGAGASNGKVMTFGQAPQFSKALAAFSLTQINSLNDLEAAAPKVLVVGDASVLGDQQEWGKLRKWIESGGHLLLLNAGRKLCTTFPDLMRTYRSTKMGEIVSMHVPESPVFDGIEPLDMSWFELGQGNVPIACRGTYGIDCTRNDVVGLAQECDQHGYLKDPAEITSVSGFPIVEIQLGRGRILASEMALDAGPDDPIARRLLDNMILSLER